jgi:hypothetical protein
MMTVNMKKTVLVLSTLLMMALLGCEVIDENLGSSALQTGTGPQGPKGIVIYLPQGQKFVFHSPVGLGNMCLDLPNGNTTNGTNVQLYYCNGAKAQEWILDSAGYIHYGDNYNKCLDAEGPSSANGTAIQIWDCKPGLANQKWTEGLGDYTIRTNQDISKCIDVKSANPAPGTKIQLYDCNGTDAQKWAAAGNDSWAGFIISTLGAQDMCLDLPNGNTANGTALQLYSCANVEAQQWILEDDGHIHYSGDYHKCLDARGPSSANGTIIQLWDCIPGQANQVWIIDYKKGTIQTSQNSGQCIDVKGASTANHAPIQLWGCNNSTEAQEAQHWFLPGRHLYPGTIPTCSSCSINWDTWTASIKLLTKQDSTGVKPFFDKSVPVTTVLSDANNKRPVLWIKNKEKPLEKAVEWPLTNGKDILWWKEIGLPAIILPTKPIVTNKDRLEVRLLIGSNQVIIPWKE